MLKKIRYQLERIWMRRICTRMEKDFIKTAQFTTEAIYRKTDLSIRVEYSNEDEGNLLT